MADSETLPEPQKQIKSVLRYGEKRQHEIKELINNSGPTVRKHLDRLAEQGDITRDDGGQGVSYYIPEHGRDPILPLPHANPDEVHRILYKLQLQIGKVEDSGQEPLYTVPWRFTDLSHEFLDISSENYFVLNTDQNLDEFLKIFDYITSCCSEVEDSDNPFPPKHPFHVVIFATTELLTNWQKGKENEALREELMDRTSDIHAALENIHFGSQQTLHELLRELGLGEGRKGFKTMAKSPDHDLDDLLTTAFYLYDAKNDLTLFLEDMEEVREELDESDKERAQYLIDEAKRRYTRV